MVAKQISVRRFFSLNPSPGETEKQKKCDYVILKEVKYEYL